jgi:transposase
MPSSTAAVSATLEDFEIITPITGISKLAATTFLAEIGCIGNYASHKKLIAFAGIDPTLYQSGKFEGSSRISKRGNRHLRRVIWLMTTCVIQHNAIFRTYFMEKRSEGQPFKKAMFATAHKLVRVIFAMLTQRIMFREVC